jgi:sec-independent protein translocase protein TatC
MISHTASARCAAVRGGPASTAGPHHQRARPAPALLARPAHPSPPPARPPARRSPVARAEAEEGSGSASPSSSNADVGTQGVPGLEARAAAAVAVSAFPADLARPGEGGEGVEDGDRSAVQKFLYPDAADLPDDFAMPIWDHLDELRERVLVAAGAATLAVGLCFAAARDLVIFLEAPVAAQGVRFLQLSPGEFFFTTLKVGRTGRVWRRECF